MVKYTQVTLLSMTTTSIPRGGGKRGNYLQRDDIEEILNTNPDVMIFGTGKYGTMKVSNDVKKELEYRGVEFICVNTDEAYNRHNEISGSSKKVVTAIHLNC